MIYQCPKCQKFFDHKTKYTKHLERKKDCITNDYIVKDIIVSENGLVLDNPDSKYCCLICNRKFAFSQSLSRHKKTHTYDNEKNVIISKTEIDEIKKLIFTQSERIKYFEEVAFSSKLKNCNNFMNSAILINNGLINNGLINNGTINNTVLLQFGKESVYDLNRDEIKTIENSNTPYKQIIETFHFNPNRPQTQNIKCFNVNGKYLEIYDGKSWIKIPLDDLLLELYNNHTDNLSEIAKMDPESEEENKAKAKLQDVVNEMLVYYQNTDKPGTKEFSEDIKLLLYNKTRSLTNDLVNNKMLDV